MILAWLLAPFRWLLDRTAILRTLSFGYIRQRLMRTGLILASIALGVATLVATRALNANLNKVAKAAANPLSGKAHLVVSNGQTGLPQTVVKQLDQAKADGYGIREVMPMTAGRILVPELENRSILLIAARLPSKEVQEKFESSKGSKIVPFDNESLGVYGEIWPAALASAFEGLSRLPLVSLSPELANDLAVKADDTKPFFLSLAGHQQKVVCAGTVQIKNPDEQLEKSFILMETADAGKLLFPDRPDYVLQVNLILDSPKDALAVRDRLQQLLGADSPYHVETLADNFETAKDVTAGLELGFAIGGASVLVVGLFLVYNALSVSVAERRHDIGILRSVGATRSQIAGLFVGEAALLGLIGSLAGVPLGYLLARLALGPISRMASEMFAPMDAQPIELSPWTVGIALVAGIVTTVLAALLPAVQASMEEPADAVRRVPVGLHFLYRLAQIAATALLLGAGILSVVLRAYLPLRMGVFVGIILMVVGALVATPLLSAVLCQFLKPLFRRIFGLEGRLAADNLARSPGRTGLVIAVLAATGALMVQTAGFIRSSEDAVIRWLDESIAADLFVTAGGSMTEKASEAVPMDENLGQKLRQVPGVDAVLPVRLQAVEFRQRLVVLVALDSDAFRDATEPHALAHNLERYQEGMRRENTALVSNNFAALYGVHIGDRIKIDGPTRQLEVTIIGTVLDYTWNRGTIIVNRAWYRDQYQDTQVNVFDVYLKKGADRAAVLAEIDRRWHRHDGVYAVTRDDMRNAIATGLRKVYALAYAQQSLAGMVSLLGVISALFISVLQSRRELGLLRAVGASRAQVLRTVLAEAFQMGVIGGVLGFGVGLLLEWYVIDIVLLDEAGFEFPLVVPWVAAAVVFVVSVLTASLVGLWPASLATRIRIAEAIAYE